MFLLQNYFTIYSIFAITTVTCFSPDQSSFDAYGLKLAANDIFLVKSLLAQQSFLIRLAPFGSSLPCQVSYNSSDQYIYSVAVARLMQSNDTIRFVFIGINKMTNIPFIGSLNYIGASSASTMNTEKVSRKTNLSCTGWDTNNYKLHYLNQFIYDEDYVNGNLDSFIVVVE